MMPTIAARWRSAEPWVFGLLFGAGVGLLVLGIGGRVAMRAIALTNGTPASFSVGGTMTVIFLGAVSGVGGGLLYALLHLFVPRRRILRTGLFGLALIALTLRGLRPIQPGALEWFMPLALAYGAIVDVAFTSRYRRQVARGPSMSPRSPRRYSGGA